MRLRHKQPLNPYKGQTNNDKSEFNDDDFRQQGSSLKNSPAPATDQLLKYAKILTKFIKTINQDALQFQERTGIKKEPSSPPLNHERPDSEKQRLRDMAFEKKEQDKEQKQVIRTEQKIQMKRQIKQRKSAPKKREILSNSGNIRQNKNGTQENAVAQIVSIKPGLQVKPTSQSKEKPSIAYQPPKTQSLKSNGTNSNPLAVKNQNFPPANSLEANMRLNNQNNNMTNFLGMQGIVPGMVRNPNMLNINGLNQMEIAQLFMQLNAQNYMYGSVPNMGDIPLGMNIGMMGLGQPFMFAPQMQPAKPIQNLFSEQVKTFKLPVTDNEISNIKTAYPLKRSAFHVAIAYKIYLDKLKKKGQSFQNLQEIDPTRNARIIKTGQQSKNGKDVPKKKK